MRVQWTCHNIVPLRNTQSMNEDLQIRDEISSVFKCTKGGNIFVEKS